MSILQYFRPSLSYHLSFRSLFCLFFEWTFDTGFNVIDMWNRLPQNAVDAESVNSFNPMEWRY